MRGNWRAVWLLGTLGLGRVPAQAADFGPIPSEVWALREDPAAGVIGAVVLEDRLTLESEGMDHTYRVRILSEAGRRAAELAPFGPETESIEGRTVYRDGRHVRFGQQDFTTVKARLRGSDYVVSRRLAAPGVTADCVVELRWRERAAYASGLPYSYGFFHQWAFGHRYKTLLTVVKITKYYPLRWVFGAPPDLRVEIEDERIHTIRNLPPQEEEPFALPTLRQRPRLTVFAQVAQLAGSARRGVDAYWEAAGLYLRDQRIKDVTKGKEFAAFARETLKDLPEDPQEKAIEIRVRLEKRIVNTDALAWEEKQGEVEKPRPWGKPNLEAVVTSPRSDGRSLELLYLHLLREAGLKPTVALVADRNRILFRRELLCLYQLGEQYVGISAPGRSTLYVDPGLRFASPFLIHPAYQGASGLELDLDLGTLKPVTLPIQPAAVNLRRFDYEIQAGEEQDRFRVVARFRGYPQFAVRQSYMVLDPEGRQRELREDLEELRPGLALDRVAVRLAGEAVGELEWEAQGHLEVEEGRRRVVVPFPALPPPLAIPPDLPEKRTLPIVLPYAFVHEAVARVTLPRGLRPESGPPLDRSNRLGRVSWSVKTTEPGRAEVALRIETLPAAFRPEAYGDFKDLLSWMQEATSRTLALERTP